MKRILSRNHNPNLRLLYRNPESNSFTTEQLEALELGEKATAERKISMEEVLDTVDSEALINSILADVDKLESRFRYNTAQKPLIISIFQQGQGRFDQQLFSQKEAIKRSREDIPKFLEAISDMIEMIIKEHYPSLVDNDVKPNEIPFAEKWTMLFDGLSGRIENIEQLRQRCAILEALHERNSAPATES